jgi:hypothetical protein
MWDEIYQALMGSNPVSTLNTLADYTWTSFWKGVVTFMISQPLDTTFGNWLEFGNANFSKKTVKTMMRLKSLITASVVPLMYMSYEPAYGVATALSISGMTLMMLDPNTKIEVQLAELYTNLKLKSKKLCGQMLTRLAVN